MLEHGVLNIIWAIVRVVFSNGLVAAVFLMQFVTFPGLNFFLFNVSLSGGKGGHINLLLKSCSFVLELSNLLLGDSNLVLEALNLSWVLLVSIGILELSLEVLVLG